jgi:hypothetical protein
MCLGVLLSKKFMEWHRINLEIFSQVYKMTILIKRTGAIYATELGYMKMVV